MGLFDKLFGSKNNAGKLSAIDYNRYFDNTTIDNTPLAFLNLGELNLSTGKIVACDPLAYIFESLPFAKTVQQGKYPVIVCVAKTENSGDRYAIVKLEFSKEKAIKWELALTGQEDISELTENDAYIGFPVDAGLGCFCDFETQKAYKQFDEDFMRKNPGANIYDDFFAAEFKKNAIDENDPQDAGDWLNFYLPNKPALNIIMFHSGYGDGAYPCYWGIDGRGKICSLVVDFQVF